MCNGMLVRPCMLDSATGELGTVPLAVDLLCFFASHAGSHCGQLQLAVLSLFWLHVTRRLAETLSLTTHRPGSRIHVAAWAIGTLYYVAMPWTLAGATCSTQAVESLVAAGPALSTVLTATGSLPRTATAAIAAIVAGAPVASSVALALFVTGQVVQAWVHYKLAIVRCVSERGACCGGRVRTGHSVAPACGQTICKRRPIVAR